MAGMRHSVFFLPLFLFATACNRTPPAPPAAVPPGPRIVCTVPAATANLVELGATDKLVGVSRFDSLFLPEEKKNLPVIGDYDTLDYERVVALQPTAIILQTAEWKIPARLKELATAHHFEIINIRMDTIDDLWTTLGVLGKAAGAEKEAEHAIALAKADLAELAKEVANQPRVKVLYAMSRSPMMVAGGKTFVDEMLTLAGGDNVGRAAGESYPVIDPETLIKLAPDVLLVTAPSEPAQVPGDPRIDPWLKYATPAARNNRIKLVTSPSSEMLTTEIAKNIRELYTLMHEQPKAP